MSNKCQFINPLEQPWNVTSKLGERIDPIFGNIANHKGVDIAIPIGTKVRAAASGTILYSKVDGSASGGYGQYVVIKHDDGTVSLYGHLDSRAVNVGERVEAGQLIGLSGNTGKSKGAHLHFQITKDDPFKGEVINPLFVTCGIGGKRDLPPPEEIGKTPEDGFDTVDDAENAAPPRVDPLVLDLDGDGIELIGLNNSNTFFDLDEDGLKEQVGWLKSDDGFLVLDSNNNGLVDNIRELFGYAKPDGTQVLGSDELKTYDLNDDGFINNEDVIFNNLQIWQDLNQDGISQNNELKTLSDLKITKINVNDTILINQVL